MSILRNLIVCSLMALSACTSEAEPAQGPVVLAASSMQEALTEAATSWAGQGRAMPVLSFAASSAIARQVESGAPADLVVTADAQWMDWLDERGLVNAGSRRDVAGNILVLIAPLADPQPAYAGPAEALEAFSGRLAMGEPAAVPAGRYGREALTALGMWDRVQARVVPAENVRAALALVEQGEAGLGIVYASDAQASAKVVVAAAFAPDSHSAITYPAALIARSEHPDARAFLDFLSGEQGQTILRAHGFTAAP